MGYKIDNKKKEITYSINADLYPIEIIRGASFVFADRAHIFMQNSGKKNINIRMRLKEKLEEDEILEKKLEYLAGEFNNEMLNQALRKDLGEQNKNIREYIISQALFGASPENVNQKFQEDSDEELDELLKKELKALEEEEKKNRFKDPYEILVPWKNKNKSKFKELNNKKK